MLSHCLCLSYTDRKQNNRNTKRFRKVVSAYLPNYVTDYFLLMSVQINTGDNFFRETMENSIKTAITHPKVTFHIGIILMAREKFINKIKDTPDRGQESS